MVKINPLKRIKGYNMTLSEEVKSMRGVTVEHVRKLYGDVGADIFEGKKPSILSDNDIKNSKKIINRIKAWWCGSNIYDYEEKDRLRDVILKYAYNKKTGKVCEIEKLFGKEGVEELGVMKTMGYIVA